MKKHLLLLLLLVLSQVGNLRAQKLFTAPDTVCINQPVTLTPDTSAYRSMSYYWGFCSGYLMNAPTGDNLGRSFGFQIPAGVDIAFDSGKYYGFVVNSSTNQFLRLNFGNSLSNIPSVTNMGSIASGLPKNPTSIFILKDTISHNWYIYVTGGFTQATSTIGRIDFGLHLSNPHPNVANFGNYNNLLNYPKGIFVAQDADNNWYGYVVNHNTSNLIRLDFSFNESNTPRLFDYGNFSGSTTLSSPTDLAAIKDGGMWYLFITNEGISSSIARIDLGASLAPSPAIISGVTINDGTGTPGSSTFQYRIDQPSSITITRDCGNLYAYITDSTTSQLVGIQMATVTGSYNAVDYNNIGFMNFPSSISSVLRDHDNLYAFITNPGDSSLTRVNISQCHNTTIPSYTELVPPVYSYNAPGVYNIYFVINDGQPNMQTYCRPITVLANPPIYMNSDTTICRGDTAKLYAVSTLADSIRWQAVYNIDTSYLYRDSVRVFPNYTSTYPVTLYYPFGCIVDTSIKVFVDRIKADAGPDRWIHDGASTIIGGPFTTSFDSAYGHDYTYNWQPFQFLSDSAVTNPTATPPYDYTYILTVSDYFIRNRDTMNCVSRDTVVVHVDCADLYLPNAFAPNGSNPRTNRFGLINNEIVQLSTFKVFDRWGAEMFTTTDPSKGWDGTFNNKPAEVGVYVWVADGFCISGKRFSRSGNVTLLR
jgi:gliding motility-associated-like protein